MMKSQNTSNKNTKQHQKALTKGGGGSHKKVLLVKYKPLLKAQYPHNDRKRGSIHKAQKQSTLIKEGQNFTKLKLICALEGELGKETHQSFYLTQIHWKQL